MKQHIKLSTKQRTYLYKLRNALKCEVAIEEKSVGTKSGREQHLRDTVRFISKIISNGRYHADSSDTINSCIDEFHKLIEKHGK